MKTICRFFLFCLLLAAGFSSCKKEESISASRTVLEIDYLGEDITLTVEATSRWTVVPNYAAPAEQWAGEGLPSWVTPGAGLTTETGWISCSVKEGGAGTTQLTVHVDASTQKTRIGSLVFTLPADGQTLVVRVFQQGRLDRDMSDKLSPGMVQALGPGNLIYEHILGLKTLNLEGQPFDCSADLVYFEGLEELHCSGSGLTGFPVPMPKLKVLRMADCQVRHMDPALFPSLEQLDCSGNPLESLEILTAPTLWWATCNRVPVKELSLGPYLKWALLQDCGLERLDLSRASKLEELDCSYNKLQELDASSVKLTYLDCYNNPQLSSLKLPADYIRTVHAANCNFSGSLTISVKDLFFIDLQNNKLEKLSFTESVNSCMIKCDNNRLTEIVLPPVTKVDHLGLTCSNNLLQELRVNNPDYFAWKGSDVTQNPGKDGVFTIYIDKEPDWYWVSYLWDHWQYQGQDVSIKYVIGQ